MVFQVVGGNSRRTKVEIALPITASGEPVLDEDDHPIEGREPVVLVLPRYGFIPRDQLRELTKASAEVDKRKLSNDYGALDRAGDSILAQLGPLVSDEVRGLLETLMVGELQQIAEKWSEGSASPLSLPESSASNGSSRTTRGPSTTTSSATATA